MRAFCASVAVALLAACGTVEVGGNGDVLPHEDKVEGLSIEAIEAVDGAADRFAAKTGVHDFSILLMDGEETLLRRDYGSYDLQTVLPLASATKWVTASTVMTLVDDGRLDLDAPIVRYLPELPSTHASLTVRQLLSYTAGFSSLAEGRVDILQDRRLTLKQAALELAKLPLVDTPGTTFAYGGADFQFVGAVVESITGQSWKDYFYATLGDPLGMSPFLWHHPDTPLPPDQIRNPLLQAGAATSMDAYAPLLTMIDQRGVYKGRRYLSEMAVAEMSSVQTHGKNMRHVPAGAPEGAQYNLANWCEAEAEGHCALLSSPGAYGVYPWIDRRSGLHGIIFLEDRLARIADDVRELRDTMITVALGDAA